MRGAPGAPGARRLRGRFKEAPGRGPARAAGGLAGGEPSVQLPRGPAGAALPPPGHGRGGGGLRARAEPGPERAVSGRRRGRGGDRPRRPQLGRALCSGAGGVAAPWLGSALHAPAASWDWLCVAFGPPRGLPRNGVRSRGQCTPETPEGGPADCSETLPR